MALVPARRKGTGPDGPIERIDERWLKRWPDDFEPAGPAAAQQPAPPAEQPEPAPAAAPPAERSRF